MSSRTVPPPPASSHADPDLDSTAELPVLDPPVSPTIGSGATATAIVAAPSEDPQATTDTWAVPAGASTALAAAAASAEALRRQEAELQSRTAALQEAQERLASHGKRLVQLERARDEALAAQAATAERAAGAEQRAAAFEQRIVQIEQRAARLSAELLEWQATAEQYATRLEESVRGLQVTGQRAAAADEELGKARAVVNAAHARAQELQQRLEDQESETRAAHTRELEQQQATAAAGRAHAAGVMEDLHTERARAMAYLESLQTVERCREITQEQLRDAQHEAEVHAVAQARLARELAAREERARRLEGELTQHAARVAQLEQQASTLGTMLSQRDAQLQHGQQESQGLRASITRLQSEINAGAERLRAIEARAAQRDSTNVQQQSELQQLRSEVASANAALEDARRAAAAATAQAGSQQAALAQQGERATQLQADLIAERQRAGQLEGELAKVRGDMEEWGGVLRTAQQERGAHLASLAAAESRARGLEQDVAVREESVRALQAECAAHEARLRDLENDLHAAEEALHRLEAEARNRGARIGEVEKSGQEWSASAGEARPAATDCNPALHEPAGQVEEEGPAAEPVPDGATCLLIQSEEGREVVHVLGRKTSIGRTPDNDLQLDAKFISRHHAVILVGPVTTVIEDLNSTNGVQVNGRRVTRQMLRDGDQIVIGRMQYRFAVRKPADKR